MEGLPAEGMFLDPGCWTRGVGSGGGGEGLCFGLLLLLSCFFLGGGEAESNAAMLLAWGEKLFWGSMQLEKFATLDCVQFNTHGWGEIHIQSLERRRTPSKVS